MFKTKYFSTIVDGLKSVWAVAEPDDEDNDDEDSYEVPNDPVIDEGGE